MLAGAGDEDIRALSKFGLSVGLAYQILDDIQDLTNGHGGNGNGNGNGQEAEWCDLRDGKRTLPLWYALNHGSTRDRMRLADMLDSGRMTRRELRTARDIVIRSGGIDFAANEIRSCLSDGRGELAALAMDDQGRDALWRYTGQAFGVYGKAT